MAAIIYTKLERAAYRNFENAARQIVIGYYNEIVDGYREEMPDDDMMFCQVWDEGYYGSFRPGVASSKAKKELRFLGTKELEEIAQLAFQNVRLQIPA